MSTDQPTVYPSDQTNADTECRNCGTHVSERFARVFGDNHNQLFACPECKAYRDLKQGAGSDPDYSRAGNTASGHEPLHATGERR